MTCSEFLDCFSDFVDGSTSREVPDGAGVHLRECASCRRYLQVYERGRTLLRSFPRVEVTDDFHPRLTHRIYHIEDGEPLSRAVSSGSATTAATALGMAVLLVLAAWSPVLVAWESEVELSPIVVTRPAPRPLGLQVRRGTAGVSVGARDVDGWMSSQDLLFQYSPLGERNGSARLLRTGLD